jgi:hypothetical protein
MQQDGRLFCPKKVVESIEFLYLSTLISLTKLTSHEKNCLTYGDANAISGISI